MKFSRITGTGGYLPDRILSNHDLEKMVDTTDEWIQERTGIKQRHIAAEGETTADLGAKAARLAMQMAAKLPMILILLLLPPPLPLRFFQVQPV